MKRSFVVSVTLFLFVGFGVFLSCSCENNQDNDTVNQGREKQVPHWHDGVLDDFPISYSTVSGALSSLDWRDEFEVDMGTIAYFHDIPLDFNLDFDMPDKYTVDIEVVDLPDVGIEEPATMQDIVKRYQEHGYRPLTPREILNLRINFKDQPRGTEHTMSNFYTLPNRDAPPHPRSADWVCSFLLDNSGYNGKKNISREALLYDWDEEMLPLEKEYPLEKYPTHAFRMCADWK